MQIDFSAKIKDLKGAVMKDGDSDVTLGAISCTALFALYPDEQNLAAEEKVKRFRLAQSAVDGGVQDIPVDDVAALKKLIGRAFNPLVVGRAFDIIDPPKPEEKAAGAKSKANAKAAA